jgi:Nucleotidyltransferase domain
MDHLALAERFIAAHFPAATSVILAGSTARGTRTPSSDLDLLVIGESLFADVPAATGISSHAATYGFEGEAVEVFAYTPSGFEEWARRGVAQHRPVIVHMLVEGLTLRAGPELPSLRERWASVLDAGPTVSEAESATRRYVITDLLDDYRDVRDPLERHQLAAALFDRTAELILLTNGRWIASGKWLPRRLRDFDPQRARLLSAPLLAGDHTSFAAQIEHELDIAGGRIHEGYER